MLKKMNSPLNLRLVDKNGYKSQNIQVISIPYVFKLPRQWNSIKSSRSDSRASTDWLRLHHQSSSESLLYIDASICTAPSLGAMRMPPSDYLFSDANLALSHRPCCHIRTATVLNFAAGDIDQTLAPMPQGLSTTSGDGRRRSDGPSQVFTVSDEGPAPIETFCRVPGSGKGCIYRYSFQTGSGAHTTSYAVDTESLTRKVKWRAVNVSISLQ
jgi:hypothetical protein